MSVRPTSVRHRLGRFQTLALLFVLIVGCSSEPTKDARTGGSFVWPESLMSPDATVARTNFSEDLILDLSPKLSIFADQFSINGNAELDELFGKTVQYTGLQPHDLSSEPLGVEANEQLVVKFSWPLQESGEQVEASRIWRELPDDVVFSDTRFGVLAGKIESDKNRFRMKTKFEGRFSTADVEFGLLATQWLDWAPGEDETWRIVAWDQVSFEVSYSAGPLFKDTTDEVIQSDQTFASISQSSHERLMVERFTNSTRLKNIDRRFPHFNDWESSFQYPAVSVVDFDEDGWDDLYVMDRWGKSVLLRNEEGKFRDVTEESGLVVDQFANCALFFDFDNDGDPDAFIGRTLKPSVFFRNEDGKFQPEEQLNDVLKDVKFVVSGSVADINRDGLLDIYLSTYCTTAGNPEEWATDVVRDDEVWKMIRVSQESNPFVDRGGPPNIVLMNNGGSFERPRINQELQQWKCSYQSVWYDVDRDGDADLYICNDFAPDVFLRNDTVRGAMKPNFVDVTSEVFPGGSMGFGMGAQFGDYDSDGMLDLYVSNMYSKAGMRIIGQLDGKVDPRIKISAQGNFLYKNQGGQFTQVAGLEEDDQHVAKVGWSFGGQFADFDNDTKLDLYVPSGYFTPPSQLASTTDL